MTQPPGLAAGTSPGAGNAQAPNATPAASPPPATTIRGSFTGQDFRNRYGDVQVQVIISNGRITDIKALQLPYDRARSADISQVAGPMLRNEALQAQSARIDIISGATSTSESYAQSLEKALQQANMRFDVVGKNPRGAEYGQACHDNGSLHCNRKTSVRI